MKKKILIITLPVLVLAVIIAFVCLPKAEIDQSSVVGSYTGYLDNQIHYLELKSDGTYMHRFTVADGKKVENTNSWSFKYSNGKPYVLLTGFVTGVPIYDEKPLGVINWDKRIKFAPIERPLIGNLRFYISDDLDYYFVKQKSEH